MNLASETGASGQTTELPKPAELRERGILFSPEMVRAIDKEEKTQTRRVADVAKLCVRLPRPAHSDPSVFFREDERHAKAGIQRAGIGARGAVWAILKNGKLGLRPGDFHLICPYAEGETHLGDFGGGRHAWVITPRGQQRLWVRETWAVSDSLDSFKPSAFTSDAVWYPATNTEPSALELPGHWGVPFDRGRTRSGRFMPRWASRTDLEVVSVRLEHLQDITDEDILAEGITIAMVVNMLARRRCAVVPKTLRTAFAIGWDIINGTRAAWASNPWVWRIAFRRVR